MTNPTPVDLDALDRLHAATSNRTPWHADGNAMRVESSQDVCNVSSFIHLHDECVANRDFIVAAHNAYPAIAAELRAAREELAKEKVRTAEAERQYRILDLSIHIEEELSDKIDTIMADMATDQWTTCEVARLLKACQQRMASDWIKIGNLQRDQNTSRARCDLLAAEVRAWREWYYKECGEELKEYPLYQAMFAARSDTDAAGALEVKS